MSKKVYEIEITSILKNGVQCSNPTIVWESPNCGDIECIIGDGGNIKVSIPDGCEGECFYATISCEDDCATCEPRRVKICPCDSSLECDDCESCVDNVCVSNCETGDVCVNGICSDCDDDHPCEGGKVCVNGDCQCPPSKPYMNDAGECIDCSDDSHCGPCEECTPLGCKPIICPEGVCNPNTGECDECRNSGDCDGPNERCKNGKCECAEGFVRNRDTGECEPAPECDEDSDCNECQICVGGTCQDIVCPDGYVCYKGNCVPECDCGDGDCPAGRGCTQISYNKCACLKCEGECDSNSDCDNECVCLNGNCKQNPCDNRTCDDSSDCGIGCGCLNGKCLPCETIPCDNAQAGCNSALGCVCDDGDNCNPSPCGNKCDSFADCGEGCACVNGICVDCASLSCSTNQCDTHPSCGCVNGNCVGQPDCPDNDLYVCDPATTVPKTNCAKVFLGVEKSAVNANEAADFNNQVKRFVNRLGANPNGNYSTIVSGFNHNVNSVVGTPSDGSAPATFVKTSPNISMNFGGGTNYTGILQSGYDTLSRDKSDNPGNCANGQPQRRILILFTASEQNSAEGNLGGGDPGTLNSDAIALANDARAQGFEVYVVAYGASAAGDNCDTLTSIAGNSDNLILAPDSNSNITPSLGNDGPKDAFDKLYNEITTTSSGSGTCRPATQADIDAGRFTFCESDCDSCGEEGFGGYICTPHGCQFSPAGSMTKEECCSTCNPDLDWECYSNEGCSPVSPDGSYDEQSECIKACKCDISVSVSYDCVNDSLKWNIVDNGPVNVIVYNRDTGATSTYNNATGSTSIPLMDGMEYNITFQDVDDPDCTQVVEGYTKECCTSTLPLQLTLVDQNCDGTSGNIKLKLPALSNPNIVGPFYYTVKQNGVNLKLGTFAVADSETTIPYTSTGADTFDAIISNSGGCQGATSLNVSTPDQVQLSSISAEKCVGGANIYVDFNISGGSPNYAWKVTSDSLGATVLDSGTATDAGDISVEIVSALTGVYIFVTDGSGCTADTYAAVNLSVPATIGVESTVTQACEDQPVNNIQLRAVDGALLVPMNGVADVEISAGATEPIKTIQLNVTNGVFQAFSLSNDYTTDPAIDIDLTVTLFDEERCEQISDTVTIDVISTAACCSTPPDCEILLNDVLAGASESIDQNSVAVVSIGNTTNVTSYYFDVDGVVKPTNQPVTIDTSSVGVQTITLHLTYNGTACTETCTLELTITEANCGIVFNDIDTVCLSDVSNVQIPVALNGSCSQFAGNLTINGVTNAVSINASGFVNVNLNNFNVSAAGLYKATFDLTADASCTACSAEIEVSILVEDCEACDCDPFTTSVPGTGSFGGVTNFFITGGGCGNDGFPSANLTVDAAFGHNVTVLQVPSAANGWEGIVELGAPVGEGWLITLYDECTSTGQSTSINVYIPPAPTGTGGTGTIS